MNSIETLTVESPVPGISLTVFGAVHGNEPCGPEGITNVYDRLIWGELPLSKGKVIFVPVANPGAFKEHKRFLEEDLNRVFRDTDNPSTYEAQLANELGLLIKESDAFLDIHSTAAPGPTCVFIDFPTPENTAFAEAIGMEYAITGWPSVYAHNEQGPDSYDTTRYAFEHRKTGIIIECGQHSEPSAVMITERSVLRALAHFGMIDSSAVSVPDGEQKTVNMERIEYKNGPGDCLTKEWKHLEPISKGTAIAIRENGDKISAEEDMVMLLPKHSAKAGQEWFSLARRV